MQLYLEEEALSMELSHRSKNFIVVNTDTSATSNEWLGLITLSLKIIDINNVDVEAKEKLLLSGKSPKRVDKIPGILIAQLGKNYLHSSQVSGRDLLLLALEMIVNVQNLVGGKMVFLDSVNVPKVIDLYESFGFVKYGSLVRDVRQPEVYYQPMALDLSQDDFL